MAVGSGKSGCVAVVAGGLLPDTGRPARILVLTPLDQGRSALRKALHRGRFLHEHANVPAWLAAQLRVHEYAAGDADPAAMHAGYASAWVVVATPQGLAGDVLHRGWIRADEFDLVVFDEGDMGYWSMETNSAAAWHKLRRHFASAHQVFLSATRSSGMPATPDFVYSYDDALRDGVAKRLCLVMVRASRVRVQYSAKAKRQAAHGKVMRITQLDADQLAGLRAVEPPWVRHAAAQSLDAARSLARFTMARLLQCRAETGIPWLLHVVAPQAAPLHGESLPFIERLAAVCREEAQRLGPCAVLGVSLRVRSCHSHTSTHASEAAIQALDAFQADVMVTVQKFARGADFPMIAFTLNLAPCSTLTPLVQRVIGRSIRMPSARTLAATHPQWPLFAERFLAMDAVPQAVVVESALNGHARLYDEFYRQNSSAPDAGAATHHVQLDDAAGGEWAVDEPSSDDEEVVGTGDDEESDDSGDDDDDMDAHGSVQVDFPDNLLAASDGCCSSDDEASSDDESNAGGWHSDGDSASEDGASDDGDDEADTSGWNSDDDSASEDGASDETSTSTNAWTEASGGPWDDSCDSPFDSDSDDADSNAAAPPHGASGWQANLHHVDVGYNLGGQDSPCVRQSLYCEWHRVSHDVPTVQRLHHLATLAVSGTYPHYQMWTHGSHDNRHQQTVMLSVLVRTVLCSAPARRLTTAVLCRRLLQRYFNVFCAIDTQQPDGEDVFFRLLHYLVMLPDQLADQGVGFDPAHSLWRLVD